MAIGLMDPLFSEAVTLSLQRQNQNSLKRASCTSDATPMEELFLESSSESCWNPSGNGEVSASFPQPP